jgi:hypothetical protein
MVERGGFEPPKALPTDLQSVPFGHSGTSPALSSSMVTNCGAESSFVKWSWRWDSNPRPADYKSAALPTELRQRQTYRLNNFITKINKKIFYFSMRDRWKDFLLEKVEKYR